MNLRVKLFGLTFHASVYRTPPAASFTGGCFDPRIDPRTVQAIADRVRRMEEQIPARILATMNDARSRNVWR